MSAWRRSMSSTGKMLKHPSPPYKLPDAEAAAAEVAEAALRFGGGVAAAVEAAGGGDIE